MSHMESALIETLQANIRIRAGRLPWPGVPQEFRHSGAHSAFSSGFEAGYRMWTFKEIYTRTDCKEAYRAGYEFGKNTATKAITDLMCDPDWQRKPED